MTVIASGDSSAVTWLAPGTEVAFPLERVPPYTGTTIRPWRPPGMIQIVRAGDPYALALLRHDDDTFAGWYVNLQEPLAWTSAGYDTRDNLLDAWRPRDGDWTLKDEHELAAAVESGALTTGEAERIRSDAARAIGELELPTGWEAWEPDAPSPALRLPEGWDRL